MSDLRTGTIEQIAKRAEQILAAVAPGAYCAAQEWDNRIDCLIRLADGRVVGEMVVLDKLDEKRIRETGERLRQRSLGIEVPLHDELTPPIRIVPMSRFKKN